VRDDAPVAGHRVFAAVYDTLMGRAERAGLGDRRAALLAAAAGRTLELGAGTGANMAHYPAAVTELVLTEPDPHMARRLREKLAAGPPPFQVEVVEAGAEKLPFDDGSFDTVVSTLVLCTVDDPARTAAEVRRMLREDGRWLVFEHVRDPEGGGLARWQDRLERPWGWFAAGCHPNRDTAATLRAAGFDVSSLEADELPKAPPLAKPAINGTVTPSATG
jgi:ubiquinone/menaquinone biosynthesis C-methylase UbiE